MPDLTDTEIVAACARAMGHVDGESMLWMEHEGCWVLNDGKNSRWRPLTDRAQAMELVEKLRLRIAPYVSKNLWLAETQFERGGVSDANLLRAICLCAARVQLEKEKNANG